MKKTIKNLLPGSARAVAVAGGLGCVALGLFGQPLSASPFLGDISFNIGVEAGPPPPPVEVMVAAPGPGYVWLAGYWDGAPGHYQWTRGHWERPPQGRSHWTAPRWNRDGQGHYHKTAGGWR